MLTPGRHLDSAQKCHGGGIVDYALAKDEGEQQGGAVLLQHLQHRHAVCCGKDGAQSQAVLLRQATGERGGMRIRSVPKAMGQVRLTSTAGSSSDTCLC